jgi:hypothetical protein
MDITSVAFSVSFLPTKSNFFYSFLYASNTTVKPQPWRRSLFKFWCKVHFKCISANFILLLAASRTHSPWPQPPQRLLLPNTLLTLLSFLDGEEYHKDTVIMQKTIFFAGWIWRLLALHHPLVMPTPTTNLILSRLTSKGCQYIPHLRVIILNAISILIRNCELKKLKISYFGFSLSAPIPHLQ